MERKEEDQKYKRHTFKLSFDEKGQLLPTNCMVDVLTSEEIEGILKLFWNKLEEEQRGFILDFLFLNQMETEAGKRQRYNYNIKGKTVCQEAWKLCYRISNGRRVTCLEYHILDFYIVYMKVAA